MSNRSSTFRASSLSSCLLLFSSWLGKKGTICSIYLPSTDQVTKEDMRYLLEQLPAPMILFEDFNAHNSLKGSKKMSTKGRMLEKVLDRVNGARNMTSGSPPNNRRDRTYKEQIGCSFREKA